MSDDVDQGKRQGAPLDRSMRIRVQKQLDQYDEQGIFGEPVEVVPKKTMF